MKYSTSTNETGAEYLKITIIFHHKLIKFKADTQKNVLSESYLKKTSVVMVQLQTSRPVQCTLAIVVL